MSLPDRGCDVIHRKRYRPCRATAPVIAIEKSTTLWYIYHMKKTSLRELKEHLSDYAEQAARGETIEVTRYNKPFILLQPASNQNVSSGPAVGKHKLTPVLKGGTAGRALEFLIEDRKGGER